MFDKIDESRIRGMTAAERRLFDNVKKAFQDGDLLVQSGTPEDAISELLKAIDAAKTLRRSLRGDAASHGHNKDRFIEFLGLEVPCWRPRTPTYTLRNLTTGKDEVLTFGEIVYQVRCMVHENENLNAAEGVDHHILLDWSTPNSVYTVRVENGRFVCNGHVLWTRLREVLFKFITGIDGRIDLGVTGKCSMTVEPPLGTIGPVRPRQALVGTPEVEFEYPYLKKVGHPTGDGERNWQMNLRPVIKLVKGPAPAEFEVVVVGNPSQRVSFFNDDGPSIRLEPATGAISVVDPDARLRLGTPVTLCSGNKTPIMAVIQRYAEVGPNEELVMTVFANGHAIGERRFALNDLRGRSKTVSR